MYRKFLNIVIGAFLIYFLSGVLMYKTGINSLPIQSEDTVPSMFLPFSIIREKTLYLDSYYPQMLQKYPHPDDPSFELGMTPFYIKKVGDHYLSAFPIITPLLALPVYFPFVAMGAQASWENVIILSRASAALISAFSVGFMYLLLVKKQKIEEKKALLLTGIYAFATVNFAMLSQSMWQHSTVQLFTILGLYFLPNKLLLSGLFFGLGFISRPTAGLSLVLAAIVIYQNQEDKSFKNLFTKAFRFGLGVLPSIIFYLAYSRGYYSGISNQGYSTQLFVGWKGSFPEGFMGILFSPSKGVFIYSPVLFFSIFGFKKERLYGYLILIHIFVMGLWKHWYGGYSFGYRMASDVLPYFILMLAPFVVSEAFEKHKKVFFGTAIYSVLVQLMGLAFFDSIWHLAYDLGYNDTSWLWSVKDSEIMFNIRRMLVKIGVLERACSKCLPK